MKIYFLIVALVAFMFINVGGILPYLISSNHTELVALGVLDIILTFPILWLGIKKINSSIKEEKKV